MMTEMKPTGAYKAQQDIPEATLVDDQQPAQGRVPGATASPWAQGQSGYPGQFSEPSYHEGMAQLGGSCADMSHIIRKGFIRKVYGILSAQLLFTCFICAVVLFNQGPKVNGYATLGWGSTLASSSGLYWLIFILSIALLVALFCYKSKYPTNFYLLGAWTFSISLTIATACAVTMCDPMVTPSDEAHAMPLSLVTSYENLRPVRGTLICAIGTDAANSGINSVVIAAFLTGFIFVALTLFTFQSKIDFSFLGAGLGVALLSLIMWGLVMSVFGFGSRYLFAMAGSVIFSLYIVYDTWRLMNVYGPDDYILAAIDLYLDIINLFMMLLQLINNRD
mmetsp:Transcript_14801/g.37043  ORF Transcript_14801/g.37043 Transcript_14801/m.37043 type:complete len:335 (+) Transcript_14801:88-1092(+)|eukprot:CAMPEP_0173434550 /NCGR_PEP_ID=MMETSP1357-20121228/13106_1 /TAXON_ID=77926 /ORGANISM="Hemiselmis rufescens, Strain PCC563" /LENGTH=334 /DNA_ID=CAMNT_0014399427 /DNA_START=88 /DNA_END=1092 /DNA_ORIENTATION=-